jgi:hypothetical protein
MLEIQTLRSKNFGLVIRHGISEGRQSTLLSRSKPSARRSEMGHEEWFAPTRLSVGCGFRKETIVGMRRNGRDAPTPDLPALAPEQGNSTQLRHWPHVSWRPLPDPTADLWTLSVQGQKSGGPDPNRARWTRSSLAILPQLLSLASK